MRCCPSVRRRKRHRDDTRGYTWTPRKGRGRTENGLEAAPRQHEGFAHVADTGRVLVVDDDAALSEMLREYLGTHGYEVSCVASGAAMRSQLERCHPDVILLDLQLPGEDGLTLARYLRERYDVGIIMVTGTADTVDRVIGLEVGADDYIGKPFDPRELRARLKSVMRRLQARSASGAGAPSSNAARRVSMAFCTLDTVSHQLFDRDGREIAITTMEFDLLKVFAAHPNQVLSRDRLLALTRNREWEPFDRSIDISVARLRRKIEADPENPQSIRTIRGVGYLYVPPDSEPTLL
jgi:two-component system phosphate regulon response regulator OmpR